MIKAGGAGIFSLLLVLAAHAAPAPETDRAPLPDAAALDKLSARFAPVDLVVDVKALPAGERAVLAELIAASKIMDSLFLRQVWAGNETVLLDLVRDRSPLGQARLHAFLQNKGPWLRLDGDRPFLPGVGPKPPAANLYPAGATKSEIETWMRALPAPARAAAEGFFTTIRRAPDGKLQAIPYSVEYQGELERAAALLRDAARLTEQATLRAFLDARAAAFLSNDYYDSDVAWMKLDASIEPTIGPYEVYEDGWFSAKAAFEAYVSLRDDAETTKLTKLAGELQEIENNLPIDAKLRNPKLGGMAPIRVVNALFCAGDANKAVQAAAFNLPNDERIIKQVGSKRTLIKNVQRAKFDRVLLPISRIALSPGDRRAVSFEAFFTHILMHELMHGLGPHQATGAGGKTTTVRAALQQSYGALEEAKADIAGLFALQFLIDKGVMDRALERSVYVTFLASAFRSLRFGGDAHAKGMALQLNTLLDAGAIRVAKDGTFSVDPAAVKRAVRDLTAEIMNVQAAGDGAKAAEMLRARAAIRPEVKAVLDRLTKVPVDIEPRFITADQLLAERATAATPARH
jgi:peptidase M49-like protein